MNLFFTLQNNCQVVAYGVHPLTRPVRSIASSEIYGLIAEKNLDVKYDCVRASLLDESTTKFAVEQHSKFEALDVS